MTTIILARDYEAARSAATDMQLGHDWLHLHKTSQVADMRVARIVLADGWNDKPNALVLYQAATARLTRDGIVTDTFTGVLSSPLVEIMHNGTDYTPRHAARRGRARGIILGGLVGGAIGVAGVLAGVLLGWLPW